MRSLLTLILVFLSLTTAIFNAYTQTAVVETASRKLKIGVVAPLTGSAQLYGTAVKNGINLALSEISNSQLQIVYEDDQFLPIRTAAAVQRLITRDKVDLLITVASTPSNAAAPLAEKAKVPLLAWASDRAVSLNKKYVIRSWMSGYEEGKRIAAEALRRRYDSVMQVMSLNDYPRSIREGFEGNFPPDRIALTEEVSSDVRDFVPLILKAKRFAVQSFLVCLNPGLSGTFAKQLRGLHFDAPLFGCENFHDHEEVKNSQQALLGAWFVTASTTAAFHKKYTTKYGSDSVLSGAAIHYDIINLLQDLVEPWRQGEALYKLLMNFPRRKGGIGEFEPQHIGGDQFFKVPLVVKEIRENEFVDVP